MLEHTTDGHWSAGCTEKDADTPCIGYISLTTFARKSEAIAAWNRRALPQSALSSRLVEETSWRCFHCGEVFTTEDDARTHFGGSETDEPGCTLNLLEGGLLKLYRDAEDELRRYRQEDHEASRTFYALGSDHARALMREEEKGYERGLRDGREAAAALGGIPEGWVLVPRERTPEINAVLGSYRCGYDYGTGEEVWAALLAAAVPPLTPGEQK